VATRKPTSRGHIEERSNGTFRASVFAGRDPLTGRKRYLKQTHPTRKLAERALTKMQNEVDEQRHPRTAMTLARAIEQWLEVARHEASTRERNDQLIRLYIRPVLGGLQLTQVDAQMLERFYARLLRCRRLCEPTKPTCKTCAPLAPNTVRKIHFIVRAALDRAVRYGYLGVNGASLAEPPGFRRSEPDPPTPAEAQALLNEAARDPEWALLLSLTMTVGWRRGEICALRWADVDLAEGTITIERSQWGLLEKSTKTNQQRKVAIGPDAVERLTAHREHCKAECAKIDVKLGLTSYVFSPSPDRSTPWLPHSVSQRYRRLAETVGLRSTRLHSLRHYSATQLVSAGVDIRTVAGRLGHGSGGATTLRTYAAWSPDADRRAALTIAGIVPTPDAANRQPRAAYELLAADLAAAIVSGVLEPGTQLPTLGELGAANNMAPNTAARALAILKERGLVTVVRGQRARVVGPQVATPS